MIILSIFNILLACFIIWVLAIFILLYRRMAQVLKIFHILYDRYPKVFKRYFPSYAKPSWVYVVNHGWVPFMLKKDIALHTDPELQDLVKAQRVTFIITLVMSIPMFLLLIYFEFMD